MASSNLVRMSRAREATFGLDHDSPPAVLSASGLTLTVDATNKIITRSAGSFTTDGFETGQALFSGFDNAGNNGSYWIEKVGGTQILVADVDTLVAEGPTSACVVKQGWDNFRFTDEDISQDTSTTESQELVDDGQNADILRVDLNVTGPVNIEFSFNSFHHELASAVRSAGWSGELLVAGTGKTVTINGSANTIGVGTWQTVAPAVGEWIKTAGFSNAANNGYFKIVAVDEGTDTVTVSGGQLANEGPTTGHTIVRGGQVVNGIVGPTTGLSTYFAEREYRDLTADFARYNGLIVSGMDLNIAIENIITSTLTFTGREEASASTGADGTAADGGNTAAAPRVTTNRSMNALDSVKKLLIANAALSVRDYTLSIDPGFIPRKRVGTRGAFDFAVGTISVNGTLVSYYDDPTEANKYLAFTSTTVGLLLQDDTGNAYIIDLPQSQYTGYKRRAQGRNQDVYGDAQFSAYKNPLEAITIRIVRFPVNSPSLVTLS
jgi:hypothetical protein